MARIKGNRLLFSLPTQGRSFKASAALGIPMCQVHLKDLEGKAGSGPRGEQGRGKGLAGLAAGQRED